MRKMEEGNFLVSSFWLRFLIKVLRSFVIVFGWVFILVSVIILWFVWVIISRRVNFHWWRVNIRGSIWVLGSISVRSYFNIRKFYFRFSSSWVDIRNREIRFRFHVISSWVRFGESRVR